MPAVTVAVVASGDIAVDIVAALSLVVVLSGAVGETGAAFTACALLSSAVPVGVPASGPAVIGSGGVAPPPPPLQPAAINESPSAAISAAERVNFNFSSPGVVHWRASYAPTLPQGRGKVTSCRGTVRCGGGNRDGCMLTAIYRRVYGGDYVLDFFVGHRRIER